MTLPTRSFLPVLGLATLLAACGAEPDPPEVERVTSEAVERYRTDVMLRMQRIDGEIAALETTAATADSATAAAYGAALSPLLDDRRTLQARLDSLGGETPEAFAATTSALDRDFHDLRRRVGRAALERSLTPGQLRDAAQARLDALGEEIARAATDSTEAVPALDAQRSAVANEIARLGDLSSEAFPAARARLVEMFDALLDRLHAVHLETSAEDPEVIG